MNHARSIKRVDRAIRNLNCARPALAPSEIPSNASPLPGKLPLLRGRSKCSSTVQTAIRLAISPAARPPIPSQTGSGCAVHHSRNCLCCCRTQPTSVPAATSMLKLMENLQLNFRPEGQSCEIARPLLACRLTPNPAAATRHYVHLDVPDLRRVRTGPGRWRQRPPRYAGYRRPLAD